MCELDNYKFGAVLWYFILFIHNTPNTCAVACTLPRTTKALLLVFSVALAPLRLRHSIRSNFYFILSGESNQDRARFILHAVRVLLCCRVLRGGVDCRSLPGIPATPPPFQEPPQPPGRPRGAAHARRTPRQQPGTRPARAPSCRPSQRPIAGMRSSVGEFCFCRLAGRRV